jgi:sensitive to high expression protein 9
MEERKPSQPIPMPPPTSNPSPKSESTVEDVEDRARAIMSSFEEQKRLREEIEARTREQNARTVAETVHEQKASSEAQERLQEDALPKTKKDDVADNIERVPDEHLPSHRERQRWSLSKRFSEMMDDLLPKLAVVTQKVNTYTGTDYSGVEALRREIKEQGGYVT